MSNSVECSLHRTVKNVMDPLVVALCWQLEFAEIMFFAHKLNVGGVLGAAKRNMSHRGADTSKTNRIAFLLDGNRN